MDGNFLRKRSKATKGAELSQGRKRETGGGGGANSSSPGSEAALDAPRPSSLPRTPSTRRLRGRACASGWRLRGSPPPRPAHWPRRPLRHALLSRCAGDKSLGGCRGNRAVGTRLPLAGRPCGAAPRAAPGRLAAESVPVPFPCGAAETGRRHPSPARPERPLPTGPAQAIKAGSELGFCAADCGAVWTPRGPGSATPGGQRASVARRRAFAPRPPVAEAGSEIKARAPGPALLPYRDRKKAECPARPQVRLPHKA